MPFRCGPPAGDHFVFRSDRDLSHGVFRKAAAGTGAAERIYSDPQRWLAPWSWSADGRTLLTSDFALVGPTGFDVGSLTMDGEWTPLVQGVATEYSPEASPDGRWMAFTSDEGAAGRTHVSAYPPDGSATPITPGGAWQSVWSSDSELVYRSRPDRAMMAMTITAEAGVVSGESPERLFDDNYFFRQGGPRDYDLAPDGRFLMIKGEPDPGPHRQITVVRNWHRELLERVPID